MRKLVIRSVFSAVMIMLMTGSAFSELPVKPTSTDLNQHSLNITQRLGIASTDVARAMKGLNSQKAVMDAVSLLLAVIDAQEEEPKITRLDLTVLKGRRSVLSYSFGKDRPTNTAAKIFPAESSDVEIGRLPVSLVEEFADALPYELDGMRTRYNIRYRGFEIMWIQNSSLLKRLGVRRGDVITSVNGIDLATMNDLGRIINSIAEHKRFDIEVIRRGEPVFLDYDVVSDDVPVFLKQSGDVNEHDS
ncbi:MAG: hypothetical protein IJS39_16690 [Synergistaceae bacterium]|nr:hypothetical protein [Synergistaceae bacterium]